MVQKLLDFRFHENAFIQFYGINFRIEQVTCVGVQHRHFQWLRYEYEVHMKF